MALTYAYLLGDGHIPKFEEPEIITPTKALLEDVEQKERLRAAILLPPFVDTLEWSFKTIEKEDWPGRAQFKPLNSLEHILDSRPILLQALSGGPHEAEGQKLIEANAIGTCVEYREEVWACVYRPLLKGQQLSSTRAWVRYDQMGKVRSPSGTRSIRRRSRWMTLRRYCYEMWYAQIGMNYFHPDYHIDLKVIPNVRRGIEDLEPDRVGENEIPTCNQQVPRNPNRLHYPETVISFDLGHIEVKIKKSGAWAWEVKTAD